MAQRTPSACLAVRVKPRSDCDVLAAEGDRLVVRVRAPAAEGQANRAVTAVVAEALGVPKSAVTIARGQRARDKLLQVAGLSAEDLRARLESSRQEPGPRKRKKPQP